MDGVNFKDLETKGFVLIPQFLSEAELKLCRDDFAQQPVGENKNYGLSSASARANEALRGRIAEVLTLVTSRTDVRANLPTGGAYFATGRGIKFSWHQDHESFFSLQNHYDYLNFYMPILKPTKDKSNLCIVPFDALQKASPDTYRRVVRGGATRFPRLGERRMVFLDDTGDVHLMRGDLNVIAHTPHLSPGDLLLLRGDMIHRTQDDETERVALSFRATSSDTVISRNKLAAGGWFKAKIMMKNPAVYERMFQAFEVAGAGTMNATTLGEITAKLPATKPRTPKDFLRYLITQKRRERLLLPFARKTVTNVLADRVLSLNERWRGQ